MLKQQAQVKRAVSLQEASFCIKKAVTFEYWNAGILLKGLLCCTVVKYGA